MTVPKFNEREPDAVSQKTSSGLGEVQGIGPQRRVSGISQWTSWSKSDGFLNSESQAGHMPLCCGPLGIHGFPSSTMIGGHVVVLVFEGNYDRTSVLPGPELVFNN